jgi:hypothetical protein
LPHWCWGCRSPRSPSTPKRNLTVAKTAVPATEQRVALVIGNSAYKEAPLRNPANDANDIAAALKGLGFAVTLKTNANQKQMKQALREFGQALKKGGVGLFYYAGHGIQSRGRNYLIPVGASVESEAELEDESVDASLVLSYMEDAQNRVNIVVMDACRNNPFTRSFRSASRGLAQMEAARGSFIAYATAPGSVAADGDGRNGVYTKHLLASLKRPDTDMEKVFKRAHAAVMEETKGKQTPWVSSSLTGDFYFKPGSPGAAPAAPAPVRVQTPEEVEQEWWNSVKASRDKRDLEDYLKQYPKGRFVPLAAQKLKALASAPAPSKPTTTVASIAPTAATKPKPEPAPWPARSGPTPPPAWSSCGFRKAATPWAAPLANRVVKATNTHTKSASRATGSPSTKSPTPSTACSSPLTTAATTKAIILTATPSRW